MRKDKLNLNIGDIVVNNDGYYAIITNRFISKRLGSVKSDTMIELEFIESNYKDVFRSSAVKNHQFKDYGRPTLCGVGYSYKERRKIDKRIGTTWTEMIRRCYSKKNVAYNYYGGRGVSVSDRWLHLKLFVEDIKKIKNYNQYIKEPHKYSLDKDILGDGTLYSKDTCVFATHEEQTNARRTVRQIKSISPIGVEKIHKSKKIASEELGVNPGDIHRVLTGERTHAKGYKFERLQSPN